ncbi:unnamed protein product [Symbiodinium sp. KB8]|nr:unnamed protein product [Symbiodinium sp. KB8]
MLAGFTCLALVVQCHAWARISVTVGGEELSETSIQDKEKELTKANTNFGELETIGECCGDQKSEADVVRNAINTNEVYGSSGDVEKDIFSRTSCRHINSDEKGAFGKRDCSYFYIFQNELHANHEFAANCVPSTICKEDVVGMTEGKVATYGVVMQILQQNLGKLQGIWKLGTQGEGEGLENKDEGGLPWLRKGPMDACMHGMTLVNRGNLSGLWKTERAVKLGGELNFIMAHLTGGRSEALKRTLDFDGMAPVPAVKSFNKCSNDANIGYLFVHKNLYWAGHRSTVDLDAFTKFKEQKTKEKMQKKQAAEKALAAAQIAAAQKAEEQKAEEALQAAGEGSPEEFEDNQVTARRLSEPQVLV